MRIVARKTDGNILVDMTTDERDTLVVSLNSLAVILKSDTESLTSKGLSDSACQIQDRIRYIQEMIVNLGP